MNLQEEIERLTLMPSSDDNGVKFVRVKGPGRANEDRQMNKKRSVPVRYRNGNSEHYPSDDEDNINDTYDNNDDGDDDNNDSKQPDINRIKMSMRSMNVRGNDHIEEYLQRRQKLVEEKQLKAAENKFLQAESKGDDNSTMSKLWKNGVIRGLVNQKIISKSDLVNNTTSATNDEREIPKGKNSNLVEDPNDEDLLLHPLLAYGKLSYDEEFILPRVGKKTTLTPRNHLKSLVDEDFEFEKKTK